MGRLNTELCKSLNLEHPIVQAPIGGGASPELAAAVADAGGLGMLSVTWRDPAATRTAIRKTRAKTQGRFAVNIVIDPDSKQVSTEEALEASLDAGVDVCTFSFGEAEPYVNRVHDAGGYVMQTVGDAEAAARAADAGVDIVVAQGWEAGGHVQSEVASLPLIPRVVDAVDDVPVIAAGGIADGRGVAAVLALGAAGAWLGTRFVATKEAAIHSTYQRHVLEASETDTEFTELFDVGWPESPHRIIRNSTFERWKAEEMPPRGERPNEGEIVGEFPDGEPVKRYSYRSPSEGTRGDVEAMALYAGQSAGLTNDLPDAATVINELVSETIDATEDLSTVVSDV